MAEERCWALELDVDQILSAQGVDPASVRERSPALVAVAERALGEGRAFLAPQALQRAFSIERRHGDTLELGGGGSLRGAGLPDLLDGADEIVVTVCTIGAALEQQVSARLAGEPGFALALDGLGTAAVDALAREVCAGISTAAEDRGLRATPPLSPGMMEWPLAEGQDQIFSLVDARSIGVVLTASRLMIPRKSVSMVVGLGPRVVTGRGTCDVCHMRDTCRYRPRAQPGA